MKKYILPFIFGLTTISFAADSKTYLPEVEGVEMTNPIQPRGSIYRCDGCFPGLTSAWIQVAYNDDVDEIIGIWMWDVKNETKVQVEILEQEIIRGEENGAIGAFKYPGTNDVYGFGLIDVNCNLLIDDNFYQYEYEGFEE